MFVKATQMKEICHLLNGKWTCSIDKDSTVIWLVPGKVMLHNDFQITGWLKLDFLADTEYYPSLQYHTKEFVIRLWLSALAMTVKYTTDLACSENFS